MAEPHIYKWRQCIIHTECCTLVFFALIAETFFQLWVKRSAHQCHFLPSRLITVEEERDKCHNNRPLHPALYNDKGVATETDQTHNYLLCLTNNP